MEIETTKLIQVGKTTVTLFGETWEKHGRTRYQVLILCSDDPYSSYDGIRDSKPSCDEIREGLDWIIEREDQPNLSGYTSDQIDALKTEIHQLIDDLI
jgi:hypothetical protein